MSHRFLQESGFTLLWPHLSGSGEYEFRCQFLTEKIGKLTEKKGPDREKRDLTEKIGIDREK